MLCDPHKLIPVRTKESLTACAHVLNTFPSASLKSGPMLFQILSVVASYKTERRTTRKSSYCIPTEATTVRSSSAVLSLFPFTHSFIVKLFTITSLTILAATVVKGAQVDFYTNRICDTPSQTFRGGCNFCADPPFGRSPIQSRRSI